MNAEPGNLEDLMRGWKLREPSRRLRQRLFGVAERRPRVISPMLAGGWLSAATACVLLAMAVSFQRPIPASGSGFGGRSFVALSSNLSAAAAVQVARSSPVNNLSGATFEWTFGSASTSSMGFVFPGKLND